MVGVCGQQAPNALARCVDYYYSRYDMVSIDRLLAAAAAPPPQRRLQLAVNCTPHWSITKPDGVQKWIA